MLCSVGIARNVFLAKVASDRQKPDGLTIYNTRNLPDALFDLELLDLPGIASQMFQRLHAHRITTVKVLYEADQIALKRAWGSIIGARWYYLLRGSQEADYGIHIGQPRKSVGQSHVMPPEFRTRDGARQIITRLMSKALKRLREYRQVASAVEIRVDFRHRWDYSGYSWRKRSTKHLHAADEITWAKVLRPLLEAIPQTRFRHEPLRVSITFTGLIREQDQNLSLFDDEEDSKKAALSAVMDALNAKGLGIELGSVFWLRDQVPKRIPFGPP
jgi:DNA polymerase IV